MRTVKIWDARPFPGSALARANRLPAILKGEDQPADNSERLAFAQMAYDGKRFTAAARHWALALAGDPNLDTNCWNHYRYPRRVCRGPGGRRARPG